MEAHKNVPDLEPHNKRLSLSRWLMDNERGVATFEGRARLPEGVAPPADFPIWLSVTWDSLGGGVWRYRGTHKSTRSPLPYEREGDEPEAGVDAVHTALEDIGCRVCRCDRYAFETVDAVSADDNVFLSGFRSREVQVVDGMPVALFYSGARDPENEAEIARDVKATFGGALEIGFWEQDGDGWRVPVVGWCP